VNAISLYLALIRRAATTAGGVIVNASTNMAVRRSKGPLALSPWMDRSMAPNSSGRDRRL
jgi:hypothetical protein